MAGREPAPLRGHPAVARGRRLHRHHERRELYRAAAGRGDDDDTDRNIAAAVAGLDEDVEEAPSSAAERFLAAAVARLQSWDNPGMAASNVELARRGFAAALRGDLDAIGQLLDPEVSWHGGDPSAPGACHNRTEALAFMRQSEVIRGRRFELVDVIDAGDQVVVIMRPPPHGDEPAATVANLTTFRDGKVIEMVHYPNAGDALAAAGA